jgi:hypothetical protein
MKEGIDENVRTEAKKIEKKERCCLDLCGVTHQPCKSRHALTLLLTSLFFAFL